MHITRAASVYRVFTEFAAAPLSLFLSLSLSLSLRNEMRARSYRASHVHRHAHREYDERVQIDPHVFLLLNVNHREGAASSPALSPTNFELTPNRER